jgi:hypothetical protein
MLAIRNSNNEVVFMCSRQEDAVAFLSSASVDKENYTLENLNLDEEDTITNKYFLELEDGAGEGQVL